MTPLADARMSIGGTPPRSPRGDSFSGGWSGVDWAVPFGSD